MKKKIEIGNTTTGCEPLGCLVGVAMVFILFFVFGHWNQLQDRLAQILGLS